MHLDPQKELKYCSETGGLKLGRIYESIFNFRMLGTDNSRYECFIDKVKTIPNLEIIAIRDIHIIYSLRIPKSTLGKEKEIQELINAIQNTLITPNQPVDKEIMAITQGLIKTIIKLTGLKLNVPVQDEAVETSTFHI